MNNFKMSTNTDKLYNKHINVKDNVITVPPLNCPFTNGIGTVLFEKMQNAKHSNAQLDALTGHVDSYPNYLQKCIRTAITMRKKGIKPNDIITVCSSTHLNTSVPIIASFFLDAKPSNTDPRFTVADTIHLIQQVMPKMIFVSPEAIELIEEVIKSLKTDPEIVVFGDTSKYTPFSNFLVKSDGEETFQPVEVKNLKETAVVYFSSGSTGLPKGICLSHLSLLALTFKANSLQFTSQLVILSMSPAYWTSFTVAILLAIITHSCRLILPGFDFKTLWRTLAKYKVNWLFSSPTQIATLLQSPPPNEDLSSLSLVLFGGSTMGKEQMLKIRAYLPKTVALCVYGLSEFATSGLGFNLSDKDELKMAIEKPTCCGRPLPGFSYKIVDIDTEETLGPNQMGELRIKTEYQMNGYYNLDASSEWDADGFLRTEDVAYYDEDYCFFVVDRIREIFKYQSWQISPSKIEAVLLSHPAVESAVVIGLPHPIDVDRPTALVILNKDFIGNVKEEEIGQFVDSKTNESHKLRGGVRFVKELLLTPSGKYKRRLMRELVLAGTL